MNQIRVAIYGASKERIASIKLQVANEGDLQTFEFFDINVRDADFDFNTMVRVHRPHVYLSFGDWAKYPELCVAPRQIKRRWIHCPEDESGNVVAAKIVECFCDCMNPDRWANEPLVSVITPAYKTGERLKVPFRSMLAQSYSNWEWVILVDGQDDTLPIANAMAKDDYRIKPFAGLVHCGSIGEMKRRGFGLASGELLVELDHDDELMPDAIKHLVGAANAHPGCGFFYSDSAGIRPNGELDKFDPGWGLGYGKVRFEFVKGKQLAVMQLPPLNPKTVRSILSAPNHFRAWRKSAYYAAGGHNGNFFVCDDYELFVRTFLTTRCCHVDMLGYIQYLQSDSAQYQRFGEIHRLCRAVKSHYDRQIHERFEMMKIPDWCWNGEFGDLRGPNPEKSMWAQVEYRPDGGAEKQESPRVESVMEMAAPKQQDSQDIVWQCPQCKRAYRRQWQMGMPACACGNNFRAPKPRAMFNDIDFCDEPKAATLARPMGIRSDIAPSLIVVDGFYASPESVRDFALECDFSGDSRFYKGKRTARHPPDKNRFEQLVGAAIPDWDSGANGIFQVVTKDDPIVHHCDEQDWAGVIYLTPNAPLNAGTRLIQSKATGLRCVARPEDILDPNAWETADEVANVFNRLVLWRGRLAHCGNGYFGSDLQSGRLTQNFFFSVAK